ncbi:MAG: ABC transporter substrate-binding protein [Deltaproteobacteria bacterium]|nr:ABC transporter substrate-binding protein [Deltaproteobacteria bacterium]MBW2082934.1 ABC transporter substrate-binding protein [Deltaproteobacteria bacterium]HDM09982.1 amino acid ABC transporter substrate-binding protein [Desulfobacteraceae bacterium]
MRKIAFIIAIAFVLSLVIGLNPTEAKEPVKIGILCPITGTQAVMSEDLLTGFKLAQEEINDAGGILGRPVKLIVEDTETRPAAGMDAARKLIEVDKVKIISGGFSSGVALPIAKYCQEHKILAVFQPPTSPLFRHVGSYIFLTNVLDNYKGKVIADFAVQDSGKTRFATMFMNNAFGKALMDETLKNLQKNGAQVVSKVVYELNKVDYKAELQRLFSKKPEAIIATFYAKEGLVTAKQAYEMGMLDVNKVPWYVPEMTSSFASAIKKIPNVLEGIKGLNPLPPGALFMEKFKKKMGREPITAYAAMNYDALVMIAMAANFANSVDPTKVRDALWKIDDWYRGQSTGGDKRFDKDGMQGYGKYAKVIIRNGKIVPYKK